MIKMKFIKNRLRNRMRDQWMNECLVTNVEHMYLIA
jgi:hypothetical protein